MPLLNSVEKWEFGSGSKRDQSVHYCKNTGLNLYYHSVLLKSLFKEYSFFWCSCSPSCSCTYLLSQEQDIWISMPNMDLWDITA